MTSSSYVTHRGSCRGCGNNRCDFDIVVSHGLWQFNGVATWRALRDSSTPFCVFPHGMLDPWFKRRYPLKHLKKWLYWLGAEYRVLRQADGVLFTCEEETPSGAAHLLALPLQRDRGKLWHRRARTGEPRRQRELFLESFPRLRNNACCSFSGGCTRRRGATNCWKRCVTCFPQPRPAN